MFPDFDSNGNLPPGTYIATIDQIAEKFGNRLAKRSRVPLTKALRGFVRFVSGYNPVRIYIDGSYITKKLVPSDVDIAVVFRDAFDLANNSWRFIDAFESAGLNVFVYHEVADAASLEKLLAGWRIDKETNDPKGIIYLEVHNHDQE